MIYERLVAMNDDWVRSGLERQIADEAHPRRGGVIDPATGIAWPNHLGTPKEMAVWASALVNPDSRFYRDAALTKALEEAADFMLRVQHADGTISPGWTNYHSPPDTGFVVVGLAQVAKLLGRSGLPELSESKKRIDRFLDRAGTALLTGGCHTPNHRWVIAAALAWLYEKSGIPDYARRADSWLAEGIDITDDGEWTERSNGIYNAVSDLMLYYAAMLLNKPELLESVRKNLRMMVYLVHPDGEVVTDYSGRQDFGQRFDLSNYFMIYQLMAYHDRDPVFAAMAELAFRSIAKPGDLPNQALLAFLLKPEMQKADVPKAELPDHYDVLLNGTFPRETLLEKLYANGVPTPLSHSKLHTEFGAAVVRHRRGDTSLTIMAESPTMLALRHGEARLLGLQLASSFDPGILRMQWLEARGNGAYSLYAESTKGYSGPLPSEVLGGTLPDGTSCPWYLLPHRTRAVTHEQKLTVWVDIAPEADGWSVAVESSGPEDVLGQLFLFFGPGGTFEGNGLADAKEGSLIWKEGTVRYRTGRDVLEIEAIEGVGEHTCAAVNGVTLPRHCTTIIANFLMPSKKSFRIRLSKDSNA